MPKSGKIVANLSGGTAPYQVTIRKEGELVGNRCSEGCAGFPAFFVADDAPSNYYFIVQDSLNCVIDSRNLTSGVGSLNCNLAPPEFVSKIQQAYCNTSQQLQPAILTLEGIANSTYYKICSGSVFNCTDGCTNPTGVINTTTLNIPLNVPSLQIVDYVIRVYNGCNDYKDIVVKLYGQNCVDTNFISFYNIDFFLRQETYSGTDGLSFCDQQNSYSVTRNFYIQDVTNSSKSNSQSAANSTSINNRNVPNGNITPNIYFSGPIKPICGGTPVPPATSVPVNTTVSGIFYRFSFNFLRIIAYNPFINIFSYDVYTKITKKSINAIYPSYIKIVENPFNGVSAIYKLSANDSVDIGRNPLYPSLNTRKTTEYYKPQPVNGNFEKIGTIIYNKTAKTCVFNAI